jgi:hypothetical protein
MVPRVRLAGHAYTPHLPPIRLLRTLLTSFLPRKPPSNTRPSKERSTLARYPSSGGPSSCIIWAMASSHELGIIGVGLSWARTLDAALEWPVISPRAHLASPISAPSLFSRTDVICPASIVRVLAFDFQRCPCLLPFPCR